jgi:hypothetical protein
VKPLQQQLVATDSPAPLWPFRMSSNLLPLPRKEHIIDQKQLCSWGFTQNSSATKIQY